tara:strand:- start:241 stop:387 length:147 start_codon:yes stop_codon:yes gene_type:complete
MHYHRQDAKDDKIYKAENFPLFLRVFQELELCGLGVWVVSKLSIKSPQ